MLTMFSLTKILLNMSAKLLTYSNEYDWRSMSGNFLSAPIKYIKPRYNNTTIKVPRKVPKTKPMSLSKNKISDILNLGDNQLDIKPQTSKVVINGNPKATVSIISCCDECSSKTFLNLRHAIIAT